MKVFFASYLCVLVSCASALHSQEPTDTDKIQFEDWLGDYLLDEASVKRYCVKYEVLAHEVRHKVPDSLEFSNGFLAVDKEKKRVRYDFIAKTINEEEKESTAGIRHLQNDKEYFFGQGENYGYRLSKLDRNYLTNWDGRPVNPMLLPFCGMNSSRSYRGVESLFGFEVCDPSDIRVAWGTEKYLTGCVIGKIDSSMTCTFDRQTQKPIVYELFLHPKSMVMDKPGTKFKPVLKTEVKWKEIPKLGWRPVEVVDQADFGFKDEPRRRHFTTKVTWWTEDIPEQVFAPEDLKQGLEFPSTIQKLFQ